MIEFTRDEVKNLFIAFIVLAISFAISTVGLNVNRIISFLPIVMFGVGMGFLLHELGHKYMSMKYGYWAEFKLWPLGLVIALVSSLFGFVFAAPGAVNTYADHMSDEINGKISLAGPMTNIALALAFIIIAALIYPLTGHSSVFELIFLIGTVGFSVNSFLAAFNLLPVATLDGTKVLKWNIGIWVIAFALAAIMVLTSMTIGAENMVKLVAGV